VVKDFEEKGFEIDIYETSMSLRGTSPAVSET
jgi:hypothetical protein